MSDVVAVERIWGLRESIKFYEKRIRSEIAEVEEKNNRTGTNYEPCVFLWKRLIERYQKELGELEEVKPS
jgi:hypothetical protein